MWVAARVIDRECRLGRLEVERAVRVGCTYSILLQIGRILHGTEFLHPTRSPQQVFARQALGVLDRFEPEPDAKSMAGR
jgi:hypothetical protein